MPSVEKTDSSISEGITVKLYPASANNCFRRAEAEARMMYGWQLNKAITNSNWPWSVWKIKNQNCGILLVQRELDKFTLLLRNFSFGKLEVFLSVFSFLSRFFSSGSFPLGLTGFTGWEPKWSRREARIIYYRNMAVEKSVKRKKAHQGRSLFRPENLQIRLTNAISSLLSGNLVKWPPEIVDS